MNSWNPASRTITMIAVSLIGLSGCGGGSANNNVISTTTAATTVPAPQAANKVPDTPAGVTASGGTNKITISWNAVSGATAYTIYWAATSGVTTASGITMPSVGASYIHRGLPSAATCYYIVTARNSSGESSASEQASAATAALDGAAPYTTYCAGCHGTLATSRVTDTDATVIKTSIQNINIMNDLTLTDAQISAISAALMYNK